jgi:hypothetical protein
VDAANDTDGLWVGVISDTHSLLRPEAVDQLRGAQHIIHAGDIGSPTILEALQSLAPTTAIRGNVDKANWAAVLPESRNLQLAGLSIHILHDLSDLRADILPAGVDVVIFGHSHHPSIAWRQGRLFLNPGSAGPRRFRLPVTVASLTVSPHGINPRIHHLPI